jgi:hypothetical protein
MLASPYHTRGPESFLKAQTSIPWNTSKVPAGSREWLRFNPSDTMLTV